ncbi:MAG: 1D-myo-inosityl-2-acetamido-2-deoxy-alpha-D-glucopyranoside deacetylase [Frankiales bacterium]|nr:1D-myo-inosityl-2-acetamido-2-deoxy-alpha-D-glucopyranoside deacetylase [Frankiales bacterium]
MTTPAAADRTDRDAADGPARRLLLVHAHPDDETIGTGAVMARYAHEGAQVTLVTCTLGEEGEILVPDLALLAANEADQLGGWRITELDRAMRALGVHDHRFLGGPGRYRDSGMMGTAANAKPRAFWRADADLTVFDLAVAALVEVIREVRPQVVVTYDDFGGYGHPDHIMAHRVTTAAVAVAAEPHLRVEARPPWQVSKLYWTAMPRSVVHERIEALRDVPGSRFEWASVADAPYLVDDELITTAIEAGDFLAAKLDAMRAHATQITVDGPFFALSNNLGQRASGTEFFRLVKGQPAGPYDDRGRETDLFAGILAATVSTSAAGNQGRD